MNEDEWNSIAVNAHSVIRDSGRTYTFGLVDGQCGGTWVMDELERICKETIMHQSIRIHAMSYSSL